MKQAPEYQAVGPGLAYWEVYEPAVKTDLSCCAVRSTTGWVFIDPLPLVAEALAKLLEQAPPAAVVVTSENHARAGLAYREHLRVPLMAHAEAAGELGCAPDRRLQEGDEAVPGMRVFEIAGAAAGEIALWHEGGSLHFGDTLIHLPPYGLAPLPAKYCRDPAAMLVSLRRLAALPVQVMTFAHGWPVARASERLKALLDPGEL